MNWAWQQYWGETVFNYTLHDTAPTRTILGWQRASSPQIASPWFNTSREVRRSRGRKDKVRFRGETNGQRVAKGEAGTLEEKLQVQAEKRGEVEWGAECADVKVPELWPVLYSRGSVRTGDEHLTARSGRVGAFQGALRKKPILQ